MKGLYAFFRSSKTADIPHSTESHNAGSNAPVRKTDFTFKTGAHRRMGALFNASGHSCDDGRGVITNTAGKRRLPIPSLLFSLGHQAQDARTDSTAVEKGEYSLVATADRVVVSPKPNGVAAHSSTRVSKIKSFMNRARRHHVAPATPRTSTPQTHIPHDCWLGWDVCQAVVKGEYVPQPMKSLDGQVLAIGLIALPRLEEHVLSTAAPPVIAEQEGVANRIDTAVMSELMLSQPAAMNIVSNAPTDADTKVLLTPAKGHDANITCDKTLVTPANAHQPSESPASSSPEKTAVDIFTTLGLPKNVTADLWNVVDAEMAVVRDRLSAIERVIEELHKQGVQHPNTEEKVLTGYASADASFSTVPLDSPTSKGSQRYFSSSPVREAWWLGGNKHRASVDVPSRPSSSGASTPGPLLSEGSSFYSSVASCDQEARRSRCHEVREVPRRHWLSPFYRRKKGKASVTDGISTANVHGNTGNLTVEGPHMTRRERN